MREDATRDAHYDLLTRCLSSVHLNVREEVDISMDRLGIEVQVHGGKTPGEQVVVCISDTELGLSTG
jgi:hypothetical protein